MSSIHLVPQTSRDESSTYATAANTVNTNDKSHSIGTHNIINNETKCSKSNSNPLEPSISLHALAERHIPHVLTACRNWQELSNYGPPYWRPRSEAELKRKIAATAGPTPATEYNFVIEMDNLAVHDDHAEQSEPATLHDEYSIIGECSLHNIDWRNRVAQIGVCVWNPIHRHQGYGKQAVNELIAWATNHLNLLRLEAWILSGNTASEYLFASLGFTHEGTLNGRYSHGGVRRDTHVYGCLF